MSEMEDLMLNGDICQECNCVIDDDQNGFDGACGHPRFCLSCGGDPVCNGAVKKRGADHDGSVKRRHRKQ